MMDHLSDLSACGSTEQRWDSDYHGDPSYRICKHERDLHPRKSALSRRNHSIANNDSVGRCRQPQCDVKRTAPLVGISGNKRDECRFEKNGRRIAVSLEVDPEDVGRDRHVQNCQCGSDAAKEAGNGLSHPRRLARCSVGVSGILCKRRSGLKSIVA